MDSNGDGMDDLVLIRPVTGCLRVMAFISTGGGWQLDTGHEPVVPACMPQGGVEDTNNVRVLDVDQDNDDDILQLSPQSANGRQTTVAHVLLNLPGDRWSPAPGDPVLSLPFPDTWAYGTMDTDSDGRDELFHIDGTELATLVWTTDSDLLREIDNGRGATTRVGYRSLTGNRSYLPAGSLPTVVERVTIRDAAHSPPVEETTSLAYDGARWSDERNHLLGFESVRSTQAESVLTTRYELGDACGARPTASLVQNTHGKVFRSTMSRFVDAGAGPSFTCLTQAVFEYDCEGESGCSVDPPPPANTARGRSVAFKYDNFGNVTVEDDASAATLRRTTTEYRPNLDDYVVDRPARQRTDTWEPEGGFGSPWQFRQVAATEYIYDHNTDPDSPPAAKGDLSRKRDWNDRTDGFVEQALEYDEHGNLTKTTSPTGVVEQTFYDTERSLFPVKRCSAVGCTEQSWKLKFGLPETPPTSMAR
jgi:YD repeat-containing protein